MGGIGVVHNPFARKNVKNPQLGKRLASLVEGCGWFYETRSIDELEDVVSDFQHRGLDILAVNGGDGTLHHVLTAFARRCGDTPLPKLAILRGGTMNTVSVSLKLRGTPESILSGIAATVRNGGRFDLIRQQTLCVNDVFGFMSGAGVISRFLDDYYSGSSRGPVKAFQMVVRMIASSVFGTEYVRQMFQDDPVRVSIDGVDPGKPGYATLYGSTLKEAGLGFKLTHRAYDKKGCFHFIATSIAPVSLVPKLWHLWSGKDIHHPLMYHHGPAETVVIDPPGVLRWMIDGEMYGTEGPLTMTTGPVVEIIRT